MGTRDFNNVTVSDGSSTTYSESARYGEKSDFLVVDSVDVDGVSGVNNTFWTPDWTYWNGYYVKIPEYRAVVDKLASWAVGRGYKADSKTMKILDKIKGWGKDDFNSLLENFARVAFICGDSFAEIIKDKAGRLINLKPLNPNSMVIIVGPNGMIKGYDQTAGNKVLNHFETEEIFHLSWNRLADEVHGKPFGEAIEEMLKMRKEAMQDLRTVFHRYVQPLHIISVDTDNAAEISIFKSKWDEAYKNAETMIVPSETVSNIERVSIPQNSTIDPLPWLSYLTRAFTTASGVPEVVLGWGEETTEASAKIIYLAFQQTIERIQRWIQANLKLQLGVEIDLEFPASIEPELIEDQKKDVSQKKENVNPTTNSK